MPNLLDDARSGKEVPCFFVRWQDENDKERVPFGHTGSFRLAYEKAIGSHIPDPLKDESKMDFAEAIFGNEKTHAGRVFFEDAFLVEVQNDPQRDAQTPQILSAPKPTTFQHYLVQNIEEDGQLSHYNSKASIRGYELYWHKSGDRWAEKDTGAIAEHPTRYLIEGIRPVEPGTGFRGRMRLEDLLDSELVALLFTLDLPQECGHKLGMGRPLGLGSIRITAKLYSSDRQSPYKDLSAEWSNDLPESDQSQEKKREFERHVLNELGETEKRTLWETNRLQELLIMLRFDTGRELERNGTDRYMAIERQNESRDRYVLPNASDLVPTTTIEEILAKLRGEAIGTREKASHIKRIKKIEIEGLWDKINIT